MKTQRHKWSEKTRADDGRSSRKVCLRCDLVCVSRHETDRKSVGDRVFDVQLHFKEWWRGTELIQRGGATPACEALEVPADA